MAASALAADHARPQMTIGVPVGSGPFPAVVIAPGRAYHRHSPALEATAERLTASGFLVFRFDWRFFSATPQGKPSPDLSQEIVDLQAVLNIARTDARVQAKALWVAGKSLGSLVAWRVLAADIALRGGVLLTPVCSHVPDGGLDPVSETAINYPGLERETRPLVIVLGDQDPLCAPNVLYAALGHGTNRPRVAVIGGDHGFERALRPGEDGATVLGRNLRLGADFIAAALQDGQP